LALPAERARQMLSRTCPACHSSSVIGRLRALPPATIKRMRDFEVRKSPAGVTELGTPELTGWLTGLMHQRRIRGGSAPRWRR
jgi:hypothetical protein